MARSCHNNVYINRLECSKFVVQYQVLFAVRHPFELLLSLSSYSLSYCRATEAGEGRENEGEA